MQKNEIITFVVIINFILIVFITGIILFIFQYRKRKVDFLRETDLLNEKHKLELLTSQIEMQQQTMQFIGQEIHDNVGQKLTLATIYLQQIIYDNKPFDFNETIKNACIIVKESLSDLRQLSKNLTDDTIQNNDIITLLNIECAKINKLKKCNATLKIENQNLIIPYQIKNILVRITQEFFQNSIKHSDCSNIYIIINTSNSMFNFQLEDDGKGFDNSVDSEQGIGLINMKKRVALIGGKSKLTSIIGKGTLLELHIPLQ